MKILIIHQYFNTPITGGPLRSYYLAKGLSNNGYEVEIITGHNHQKPEVREIEGFRVHYLPVFYDNTLGFAARIIAFVKFAWLAYQKASNLSGIDLCYAISTPLSVGWVAKRLKEKKGIPYIFEVGDLWPEAPVQLGVIRRSFIIDKLRKFETRVYQQAQKVVALSPGIREGILQSSPASTVSVIPNMSDCRFFQMEKKSPELEAQFGVTGKLVISYFGAAGKANHLEYFLDAAKAAKTANTALHFLVIAHGSELSRLKAMAVKYQLNNLDFLSYRNRAELKKVLNVTDAVYVSYATIPVLATGSPNKYFDGLAAGKLMLVNFQGWLRNITEQHQLGYYVDPKKPLVVSELLEPLVTNPEMLWQFQSNARMIAEAFFSKNLAIQKLLKFLGHESPAVVTDSQVYTLTA